MGILRALYFLHSFKDFFRKNGQLHRLRNQTCLPSPGIFVQPDTTTVLLCLYLRSPLYLAAHTILKDNNHTMMTMYTNISEEQQKNHGNLND